MSFNVALSAQKRGLCRFQLTRCGGICWRLASVMGGRTGEESYLGHCSELAACAQHQHHILRYSAWRIRHGLRFKSPMLTELQMIEIIKESMPMDLWSLFACWMHTLRGSVYQIDPPLVADPALTLESLQQHLPSLFSIKIFAAIILYISFPLCCLHPSPLPCCPGRE